MKLKDYLDAEVYKGSRNVLSKFYHAHVLPNTNAVYLLRKSMAYYQSGNRILKVLSTFYRVRLTKKYGCFISRSINIGIGLKLPHPNGIVIGSGVSIGKNAVIFQQVTIGSKRPGEYLKKLQPQICDDVMLFAGCKILGRINVANGTWVGANAVLNKNTEQNYTYYGIPAKQSKQPHPPFSYDQMDNQ